MVSTHHQLTNHDIATNNNLQPFANKNNQANLLFFLKKLPKHSHTKICTCTNNNKNHTHTPTQIGNTEKIK